MRTLTDVKVRLLACKKRLVHYCGFTNFDLSTISRMFASFRSRVVQVSVLINLLITFEVNRAYLQLIPLYRNAVLTDFDVDTGPAFLII